MNADKNPRVSDRGMKRHLIIYLPLGILIILDLLEDGQLTGTLQGIPYNHILSIPLITKISIGQWIRIKKKNNGIRDMKETLRQKQPDEHHHRKE